MIMPFRQFAFAKLLVYMVKQDVKKLISKISEKYLKYY